MWKPTVVSFTLPSKHQPVCWDSLCFQLTYELGTHQTQGTRDVACANLQNWQWTNAARYIAGITMQKLWPCYISIHSTHLEVKGIIQLSMC